MGLCKLVNSDGRRDLIPVCHFSSMRQTMNQTCSIEHLQLLSTCLKKQGKSEGFDSCDRPSNLTQIGFISSIFQPLWPWNLMDDPATLGFLHHFVAIGEFKLEWQSGYAQLGSKWTIFLAVWPLNLTVAKEWLPSNIHLGLAFRSFSDMTQWLLKNNNGC